MKSLYCKRRLSTSPSLVSRCTSILTMVMFPDSMYDFPWSRYTPRSSPITLNTSSDWNCRGSPGSLTHIGPTPNFYLLGAKRGDHRFSRTGVISIFQYLDNTQFSWSRFVNMRANHPRIMVRIVDNWSKMCPQISTVHCFSIVVE